MCKVGQAKKLTAKARCDFTRWNHAIRPKEREIKVNFVIKRKKKKTKNKDTVGVLLEICEAKHQTKTKICTENLAQNV